MLQAKCRKANVSSDNLPFWYIDALALDLEWLNFDWQAELIYARSFSIYS